MYAQLIGTETSFDGSAPGFPTGCTMTWSCSYLVEGVKEVEEEGVKERVNKRNSQSATAITPQHTTPHRATST